WRRGSLPVWGGPRAGGRWEPVPHGTTLAAVLRPDQQRTCSRPSSRPRGVGCRFRFVGPVEEAALGKDVFEPLTGTVPGAIARGGIGGSTPSGRPRPDHPLGKRGADLLAQVPLFEGLSRRHLKRL